MATYIRKLRDSSGNYVSPAVRSSGVFLSNNKNLDSFISNIYPVGSIYMSTDSVSPASFYGGSWEKVQNRFLLGSGNRSVGATGGEESHTLIIPEMPSHYHEMNPFYRVAGIHGENSGSQLWARGQAWIADEKPYFELDWTNIEGTDSTGGNQSHNNMPPYYVVNIWRRVA